MPVSAGLTTDRVDESVRLIFPLVAPPDRRRTRRRRMVVGMFVLAAVVGLVGAAGPSGDDRIAADFSDPVAPAEDDRTMPSDQPIRTSVFDLQPGTCLADLGSPAEVRQVTVVPCEVEHLAEVVAIVEAADGPWPGRGVVEEFATDRCASAIRAAGADTGDELRWTYLAPTEASWQVRSDRAVSCLVVSDGAALVGSFVEGTVG